MQSRESARMWRLFGKYSAIGIEMAVAVSMGALAGNWLDNRFGTTPWFLLFGFVVGTGAAVKTIRMLIREGKADTR